MKTLEETAEEFVKLRFVDYKELSPQHMANARLKLSYLIASLSDFLPELEGDIGLIKLKRESAKLEHMKTESIAKADSMSKVEHGEALLEAEMTLSRLKHLINSGGDILNAISSKLRVLEMESRNQY